MNLIRRWPVAALFVTAYLFSFWVVPLHVPGFPLFPYGPDVALVLVVAALAGRRGLRTTLHNMRRWRAHPRWYAFALLAPAAIALAAVFASPVLGADSTALPEAGSLVEFIAILPVMILIGGALGEEPAWRGLALPLLQQRHRPM